MERLKTLWNKFRRKEEKKEIVWPSKEKDIDTKEVTKDSSSKTKLTRIIKPKSKPSISFPKIRNTFFLKLKRVLAVILFLIQLAGGFYSVPHVMSLLFFGTSFILFDYVWRTRKSTLKWVKIVEEGS